MIEYSKQDRLGRFGSRWACYATSIINIIETELGRGLHDKEIARCIGIMFLDDEDILLCNYKDHRQLSPEPEGWNINDDPEQHFLILQRTVGQNNLLRKLAYSFHIPNLKRKYLILRLQTLYGDHFVLELDNGSIVNPDPSLSGSVVERREVSI